jgi:hypothetical protein
LPALKIPLNRLRRPSSGSPAAAAGHALVDLHLAELDLVERHAALGAAHEMELLEADALGLLELAAVLFGRRLELLGLLLEEVLFFFVAAVERAHVETSLALVRPMLRPETRSSTDGRPSVKAWGGPFGSAQRSGLPMTRSA